MRRRAGPAAAIAVLARTGCGAVSARSSLSGIPSSALRGARPIGAGPRFQPPATGPVLGDCRRGLGRRIAVHVEVFAENRVVIVPAGIGTRPPRVSIDARITAARCYGVLVTIDPTGVVLIRRGAGATLAELFRAWGQPLSSSRLASFATRPGA